MNCPAPTSQVFQDSEINRPARCSMCSIVLPSYQPEPTLLGQHLLCTPSYDQPGLLQIGANLLRVARHIHRSVEDVAECAGADSLRGISCLLSSSRRACCAMVTRRGCSRHHDGSVHTAITSAGCCLA